MPGYDQITPTSAGRMLGGRYRLVVPIARGGMAEVWEAHDEILSRPVAVKVLQAHLATDGVFLERFRREAVTAARLAHPGIVATFDTGIDSGTAYIVMELVKGRNLRQLLADQGRLEPWQAVAITRQVADALSYAHQAGLVHRDVKPANILLVEDEWGSVRAKVTDFGIAKAAAGTGSDLTRTGMVLGTPKYLSPEQIKGHDPDARADLYSLGVVLYEMLTGVPPFVRDTEMSTALAHLNDRIPRAGAQVKSIPSGLDKLVGDLLAKNPERRIPSATVLRQKLDALGPLAAPGGAEGGPGTPGGGRRGGRRGRDGVPPRGAAEPIHTSLLPSGTAPAATTVIGSPTTANGADPAATAGAAGTIAMPAARGPAASGSSAPGAGSGSFPPASPLYPAHRDAFPASGPRTDEFGHARRPARRFRRSERAAGFVVLGLVVVGVIVAASLLASSGHGRGPKGPTSPTVAQSSKPAVSSVSVFMADGRPPDDPTQTSLVIDGNPSTFWETDHYRTPTFSNLYPGIGLDIALGSNADLHTLTVTSPSTGWSAQAYVSSGAVTSGQSVTAWGQPTATKTSISASPVTLSLGGHRSRYILLWITNLGAADQVKISEIAVS